MKHNVIIVDDEPHARRFIKELLEQEDDINIIGEYKNGNEVLTGFGTAKPDIIFLDVEMPGVSGIDVASQIKDKEAVVIFTTAYSQYALKAFEVEALDYLVKPFDDTRFFEVLDRAKKMVKLKRSANLTEKMVSLVEDFNQTASDSISYFKIKNKGFERTIKVEEVIYIESNSVYVSLILFNESILYRAPLHLLVKQLPTNFMRIHRTLIINTEHINQITYLNNSTYRFTMNNKKSFKSSRAYLETIKKKFSK